MSAWSKFARMYRPRDSKEVFGFIYDTAALLAFMHVTGEYLLNFTFCVGPSMKPTINETGDFVLIDLASHEIFEKPYKVGDVVVAKCPVDSNKCVCKRIAAVEGEIVMTIQRHISPYPTAVKVPKDHVWLAGDNPSNSTDSRNYGPVPVGLLQGRCFTKLSSEFPYFLPIAPLNQNQNQTNKKEDKSEVDPDLEGKALEEIDTSKLSPYELVLLKRAQYQRDSSRKEKESSSKSDD